MISFFPVNSIFSVRSIFFLTSSIFPITGSYNTDTLRQVKTLVEVEDSQKGQSEVTVVKSGNNEIVKVTERRPDDSSAEQEAPLLSVTGNS